MSPKQFNILEQHVEKIALAVGLAGAGYLIWLATQPMTIPGGAPGSDLEIENVEGKVTSAVKDLIAAQDATKARGTIPVKVPDMVGSYHAGIINPLPPSIVNPWAPRFVPLQSPLAPVDYRVQPVGSGLVQTPPVPAPLLNLAAAWRGLVFDSQPGIAPPAPVAGAAPAPVTPTPGAPAAAPSVPSKDKNLIVVSGYLPVDAFKKGMEPANPKELANYLPGEKQVSVIYRVEAQRRQHTGHAWSDWTPVTVSPNSPSADLPVFPKNPANADPGLIDQTLAQLRDSLLKIVQPVSYFTPEGRPVLAQILPAPMSNLVPGNVVTPGQPAPAPAPAPTTAPATAPAIATPAPTDPAYWIVDENIQPDAEYQYEVRLVMYNPTFNYIFNNAPGKLADESMRDKATIASPWFVLPATVQIPGDMYFYVTNYMNPTSDLPNTPRVSVPVYKWTAGHWFADRNSQSALGKLITGSIFLPDHKSLPVPTGNLVVDLTPSGGGLGNDVDAVLMDPNGELYIRKGSADREDPHHKQLDKDSWSPPKPTPPAPKTPTPPRGTPTTPPPGSSGGTPLIGNGV